jgi:enoyl-CoA hydratase/carnithine racemase
MTREIIIKHLYIERRMEPLNLYLERADKTSRMLDVRHASLALPEAGTGLSQADVLGWSAMLRSCSAWDAYKALHGAEVVPVSALGLHAGRSADFGEGVMAFLQKRPAQFTGK